MNQENSQCCGGRSKRILMVMGMMAITAIIIVAILRERIVNPTRNQVSVSGEGKVSVNPDEATVTLGVQVDKATTADAALSQLNEKISKIVLAVQAVGVPKEDVQTRNYSVNPQYDYKDGTQTVSGYGANEQLAIKVKNVQGDQQKLSDVIAKASDAGSNQIVGIDFAVSNTNDLKQQARVMAIKDAKAKALELAEAAGVKLGEVKTWNEDVREIPGPQPLGMGGGFGVRDMAASKVAPAVPSGTQDIVIDVAVTYEVK